MNNEVEKKTFANGIQSALGRNHHLTQYQSLQLCRSHVDVIVQMYEDGFTQEQTLQYLETEMEIGKATESLAAHHVSWC